MLLRAAVGFVKGNGFGRIDHRLNEKENADRSSSILIISNLVGVYMLGSFCSMKARSQ